LNRSTTYLLLVSFLPLFTLAQDANTTTYSLKEAQEQAVKNNVQVKLAALDINIATKTVQSVGANVYPQIGATGSFNHFIDIPTSVVPANAFGFPAWFNQWISDVGESTAIQPNFPSASGQEFTELQFGSKFNSTIGLNVNQLIFDGSYIIGLKAAKSFVEVQRLAHSKTQMEVKSLATQAYFSVLIAQENGEILSRNLASIKNTYTETKEQFNTGFIEKSALDQIQLLVSNMEISHNTAIEQLEISKKILNFQMGLPLEEAVTLSEDLNSLAVLSTAYSLEDQFNSENHIDYQMAQTQIKLMELNKKKEQFVYLPTLGGFFNYQRNAFSNELDFISGKWFATTFWGLSLNVPIFGGFGQSANLKIAGLQLEKAQLQQAQISEGLKLNEASARSAYTSALSLYINQKKNLALAEAIRKKTGIKFKEGLASSMELTQAENQFFSTQGAYVQSVFSLLNAKTELEKALGKF